MEVPLALSAFSLDVLVVGLWDCMFCKGNGMRFSAKQVVKIGKTCSVIFASGGGSNGGDVDEMQNIVFLMFADGDFVVTFWFVAGVCIVWRCVWFDVARVGVVCSLSGCGARVCA